MFEDGVAEETVDATFKTSAGESRNEVEPLDIETRLDDPEGEAEDLQPIRSVDHRGELRARRTRTRKRGERSSNPHGVRREKLSAPDAEHQGKEADGDE